MHHIYGRCCWFEQSHQGIETHTGSGRELPNYTHRFHWRLERLRDRYWHTSSHSMKCLDYRVSRTCPHSWDSWLHRGCYTIHWSVFEWGQCRLRIDQVQSRSCSSCHICGKLAFRSQCNIHQDIELHIFSWVGRSWACMSGRRRGALSNHCMRHRSPHN